MFGIKKSLHRRNFPEIQFDRVELILNEIEPHGPIALKKFLHALVLEEQIKRINAPLVYSEDIVPDARGLHNFWSFLEHDFEFYNSLKVGEKEIVDFSKHVVISSPWHLNRHAEAFSIIGDGLEQGPWKEDPINHMIDLYRPLDIAIVHNGFHSSAQGILLRQGHVTAKTVFDVGDIFKKYTCNGKQYTLVRTGKAIAKVDDMLWASIFATSARLIKALSSSPNLSKKPHQR